MPGLDAAQREFQRKATKTVFPFVHLRREGGEVRNGINFYPLVEWDRNRGFNIRIGQFYWRLRYAPRTGMLHWGRVV